MIADIGLRRVTASDAESTRRVFLRAVRWTASAHYTREQVDAWIAPADNLDRWCDRRMRSQTWVALSHGRVVGLTDLDVDTGYIDMLFVDPEAGRRGIGARLLQHCRAEARALDLAELTAAASITARPLFERAGFHVVRRLRESP